MPPKAAAKGGGKKKLSKAEKEKLKKEDEERRALEAEEARERAEEEAKLEEEREKQEAEERRRLENEERRRRKAQLEDLNEILEKNRNTILNINDERRKKAKWDRYMKCDGSPDPTIPGEINTYMNLWRERKESNDIDTILKEGDLTLSLMNELKFLLADSADEDLSEAERQRYQKTIVELQNLLQHKLDLATHHVLLDAKNMADPETFNLEREVGNEVVMLCVWGNLSKNPRIKHHEFAKKGFNVEIPRILMLSDCCIRALFTKYDHLSPYCKSFHARRKVKVEAPPVEEAPKEAEAAGGEEEEKKEEEEGDEKAEGVEETAAEAEPAEEAPAEEQTMDVLRALKAMDEDGDLEEEAEAPPEEDEEDEMPDEPTPEPPDWEDFDQDEDVVDLRAWSPLGGVIHFNLLHLPPQPKQAKGWIMTQVVEPRFEHMEYMADLQNMLASSQSEKKDKDKEADEKKRDEKPPITVTMRLPEDVYFCEEPQVARWDYNNNYWSLDGFTDHTYNEENRTLSFKTSHFGSLTLVQDIHINMPFQSWEIRPHSLNSAILTVIAAIIEIEIEIKDGLCCLNLVESLDRPELSHFRGKWMPPAQLIEAMQAAGLNIFPNEDSTKYVDVQLKNPVTEDLLYQQMALTASTMAYSWSKWNNEVNDKEKGGKEGAEDGEKKEGKATAEGAEEEEEKEEDREGKVKRYVDKIIIQGAEQLHDEPLLEEDWALYLMTKMRTMKLRMIEFDENYDENFAEGTNFHADLYHMVMEVASEEGKERIANTSYKFSDCVYQLLKATKLVIYS